MKKFRCNICGTKRFYSSTNSNTSKHRTPSPPSPPKPIPHFNRIRDVYIPPEPKYESSGISPIQQIAYSSLFRTFRYRSKHEKLLTKNNEANEMIRLSDLSGKDSIRELEKRNVKKKSDGRSHDISRLLPYPPQSSRGISLQTKANTLRNSSFFIIFRALESKYHDFVKLKIRSNWKNASTDISNNNPISLIGTELKSVLWNIDQDDSSSIWDYWLRDHQTSTPPLSETLNDCNKYIVVDIPPSLVTSSLITHLLNNDASEVAIVGVSILPSLLGGPSGLSSAIQSIETPWKQSSTLQSTVLADVFKSLASKNLIHSSLGPGGRLILTERSLPPAAGLRPDP